MRHRFVPLSILLVAMVGTATAQTDAELLDRIVAATQPSGAGVLPFGGLSSDLPPGVRQGAADSTRARFLADWQPEHVRDALTALDRPTLQRVAARTAQSPPIDEISGLAFGSGKSTTAADSALAGPYLRATGRTQAALALIERTLRAAADIPEARADLERRGQTVDEAIADVLSDASEGLVPVALATVRLQFAGLAPADVKAATAFELSPAGRYVRAVADEGTARALVPVMLDLVRASLPAAAASPSGSPD